MMSDLQYNNVCERSNRTGRNRPDKSNVVNLVD